MSEFTNTELLHITPLRDALDALDRALGLSGLDRLDFFEGLRDLIQDSCFCLADELRDNVDPLGDAGGDETYYKTHDEIDEEAKEWARDLVFRAMPKSDPQTIEKARKRTEQRMAAYQTRKCVA